MTLKYKGREFQTSHVDFGINSDGILVMSFDKGVVENPDMGQVSITE
jgi:hypothetical protein